MTYFSLLDTNEDSLYVKFPFYYNNQKVESINCCLSLRKAGSMRFRWNEQNPLRDDFLKKISGSKKIVPIELMHSHIVFNVPDSNNQDKLYGDGIITNDFDIVPVVTVADCMPLYLYDVTQNFFGIVHSGWKGTGIVYDAIKLAQEKYNSKVEDICVVIGPHIHDCCYIVNQERADYFSKNFTPECVSKIEDPKKLKLPFNLKTWDNGEGEQYFLSLEKANLAVLRNAGIKEENIAVCTDCTCCNPIYGSNRRETSLDKTFTVQAAFLIQ